MSHSGLGHLSILWQRVATADECTFWESLDVSASPEAFKDLFQFVKDFSSFCHNPYGSQIGGALHDSLSHLPSSLYIACCCRSRLLNLRTNIFYCSTPLWFKAPSIKNLCHRRLQYAASLIKPVCLTCQFCCTSFNQKKKKKYDSFYTELLMKTSIVLIYLLFPSDFLHRSKPVCSYNRSKCTTNIVIFSKSS